MIRMPLALGALALAALLGAASKGRADLIHWTYSWSNSPSTIQADTPGTGSITLTNEASNNVAGDSDIVATNLQVHSTATTTTPDFFTNKPYTLTLTLTDQASGASGNLVFTGELSGTTTAGNANITNTFTGIGVQSVQLGDNLYTVSMSAFTPPGPPDQSNSGSIGAHAVVVIHHLPEPSAILLGAIGLALAGLSWLRRSW
jgi:hypothetical protein